MDKEIKYDKRKAKEFLEAKISALMSPILLNQKIKNDIQDINLVDVRSYDDYIDGHIPFAIHVPYDEIEKNIGQFEKDKMNILYAYGSFCLMAENAAYTLIERGYDVKVVMGGFATWKKLNYDIVKTSSNTDM